jgi:hypothetical protein
MRGEWTTRAAVLLAVGFAAVTGCSNEPKVGVVTGKVTLDDKPADGVAITFLGADGRTATALTDSSGRYRADNVPVGQTGVGVASLPDEGDDSNAGMIQKNRGADPAAQPAKPADVKKKGPKVPDRFADPGSSGLKHTVAEGESTFDIPLKR